MCDPALDIGEHRAGHRAGGVAGGRALVVVERRYAGLRSWDVELAEVTVSGLGPFVFGLARPRAAAHGAGLPANIELEPWTVLVATTVS